MSPHRHPDHDHAPVVEPGERLDSWKEIAAFLGRGVRTVQRWEEVEGLPVHRHIHGRGGTVFAYKSELQAWYLQRDSAPSPDGDAAPPPDGAVEVAPAATVVRRNSWKGRAGLILAALLTAGAIGTVLIRRGPKPAEPAILISQIGRISQTISSPNGDRIVYCWNGDREENNLDLYIRQVQTGGNQRLTSHPNNEHSAAWSAAGDRIAFLRDKVGVFVIAPDGTNEQQLEAERPGAVYGVGMSWSPDGRWLVYSEREPESAATVLFLLDVGSRKRRQITMSAASSSVDLYPSFSPDGRTIAFVRQWPAKSAINLLRVSEAGEAPSAVVLLDLDRQTIAGLDWLADGSGIVYSSDRGGVRRLWRTRLSRWSARPNEPELAPGGDGGWQPSVARHAGTMVYSRRFWNASIWRMDLRSAATGPPALTRLIGSTRIERSPAYSPDGKRIAFISDRSGFAEVWTSDGDGRNETQWTRLGSVQPERPAWSPDANRIAFSLRGSRGQGIYVISAPGDPPRRVTPDWMDCNSPAWSHDGEWIYCSAAGVEQIWKVALSDGPVQSVTTGSRPRESPDGQWLYFAREGALWRMRTSGTNAEKLIEPPVGDFALTQRGIYFDLGSGDYTQGIIKFCDLATHSLQVVARLEKRKSGGLAISADDQMLLPINERQGSEVLLLR
jgi:Tol biopolymer transport system component